MNEKQDESVEKESKLRKYFRYVTIAASLIFFLVLVISAIMRKYGA